MEGQVPHNVFVLDLEFPEYVHAQYTELEPHHPGEDQQRAGGDQTQCDAQSGIPAAADSDSTISGSNG
jgi:hypothetical protein